jgi:hypothetical protein
MVIKFFFVVLYASQVWAEVFKMRDVWSLYCSNVYGVAMIYVEVALGFSRVGFV